jgi:hypothetical protein
MKVIMVSLYYDFCALPHQHRELFEEAGKQNFFLSLEWFRLLSKTTLALNTQIKILSVEDAAGKPQLIFVLRSPSGQEATRLAGMKLKDTSLSSLTNFQSFFFAPIVSSEVSDPFPIFSGACTRNKNAETC